MAVASVKLDDKYRLDAERIYLTGTQALVRLLLMQRQRDQLAGHRTAGFISGYRGSPLGGFDQALWQAKPFLASADIRFQPGLNEDLGATSVWGSQQVNLFPGARYQGVYALWYGKGPGVDRSGDVFKHGNAAGTSPLGGVLVVAGDDHACKSSTLPHQSEYAFMDAGIPVLNPAGVQEILDLGIYGWAMSRFSGCWVGFKTIAETVDSSASVHADPQRVSIVLPEDFPFPEGGVHIRWPDRPLDQEYRLHRHKLYAALAFARANRLDRVVLDSPQPRLGIVSTGKSYLDVMQALEDLGIDAELAADIGLRVYKVGMSWPLEREGIREFATGLEEVLVVEEKRAVIENQLKEQLYNWREDVRPRVIGKFDEERAWILPSNGELTPARIARVIARRIGRFYDSPTIRRRLLFLDNKEQALQRPRALIERTPHYCSGCPHNTSTVVPEGSRALAGIGCHYMATWMDRRTDTFTQMGGEGVTWIGQAPFTDTAHVFQNLGDGTYFHSGILAIRAAIAAGVNITYKILYNDAVAMTGGQPVDGTLSVAQITHQLLAEGVKRLVVVSDEPEKYQGQTLAPSTTVHHRDRLDEIQRELREIPGTTVLVYDQTCAAEKRRRRKRGKLPDPPKRVIINQQVCEGCGDCSVQSNCLSVIPVETQFGRKRAIDQSSCNKDFSCLRGFCPSFVTVHGGKLRKSASRDTEIPQLPMPTPPAPGAHPYSILITGIGGTGVVTIGALLGMAAHLEERGVAVLDMTGLAQKYGAVVSHVRIANTPEDIRTVRIPAGNANLLLGCDMVVAASFEALSKVDGEISHAVINGHGVMPAGFTRNPDLRYPDREMRQSIAEAVGENRTHFVDATRLATKLTGDALGANLFMLGFAWQKALVPLSGEAILQAIALNGVAVAANQRAFELGRWAAHDLEAVETLAGPAPTVATPDQETLDTLIQRRVDFLADYQNPAYAQRYRQGVLGVRGVEARLGDSDILTRAAARYYFKLMAYKDEYEVARLFTEGGFQRQLEESFEGDYKLEFSMAPPFLAQRDPGTGHLKKRSFGPWLMGAFRLLAPLRRLRGTPLDVFGYTAERRQERQLIRDYESWLAQVAAGLNADNHPIAVELLSLPEQIRGYGHVKEASIRKAREREAELLALFHNPPRAARAA